MAAQTPKSVFHECAEFLVSNGFGVIVDQVREELAAGKLVPRKSKVLSERRSGPTPGYVYSYGAPAEFIERIEYSDEAALALLLEAVKRATVEAARISSEVSVFLAESDLNSVQFLDDDGSAGVAQILSISTPDSEAVATVQLALDNSIHDLRQHDAD